MLTGALANLLLNALIVMLLSITIVYCWMLNRRIKILQDGRGELAVLLKHFDESTMRASESIVALQTAGKNMGESLQTKIEKAHFVMDDLSFMIDKCEKLADQMEAGLAGSRTRNRTGADITAEHSASVYTGMPQRADKPGRSTASLEAVLEKVAERKMHEPETTAPERSAALRPRSRSEQELLEMIKFGIKG